MGRDGGQPEPPVIVVLSAGGPLEREVAAGIEEEGVPYAVHAAHGAESMPRATDLAIEAARRSTLQVGVGVGESGDVCVHHAKLAGTLADLTSDSAGRATARALGHNAARIVVGLPLKQVGTQRPHTPIPRLG